MIKEQCHTLRARAEAAHSPIPSFLSLLFFLLSLRDAFTVSVLVSNLYKHIILTESFHKNIKETGKISDLPKAKQSS